MPEKSTEREAFEERVNSELFGGVVTFIFDTSSADTKRVSRKLNSGHLWYTGSETTNIQERNGFRYLGELLERYEECFSTGTA